MKLQRVSIGLFSAGLLIGAIALPSRADDQPGDRKAANPASRPAEGGLQFPILQRLRTAVDELKLNDDQKGKIDKLFDDARSQLREARDAANGDRQEVARKSRQVLTSLRENLMTALDDDQKAEFRTKLQTLFTARGGAGGDMVARLRTALEKLNLGGDQKREIKDVLESAEKKAKDLREKAQGGDQDARGKLGAILRDTRQKIGEILTDDQKQQLQDALQQATTRPRARQNPDQ